METRSINGRICYKYSCECGKDKGFVRKEDLGKLCKSCSNRFKKLGKPSPLKGIKTGKPAHNRSTYYDSKNKQIRNNMSRRLRHCINKNNVHIFDIVGYTSEQLIKHLESKFEPGMTWENYGRKQGIRCWEIDHVVPESWFNYSSFESEEFKECWSLSNLQPLWADDNKSKSNRYSGRSI